MANTDDDNVGYIDYYDPDKANNMVGMERAVYILSHKAQAAKLSGKSEEEVEAKLAEKIQVLNQLYLQKGDSIFEGLKVPDKIPYKKQDFSTVQSFDEDGLPNVGNAKVPKDDGYSSALEKSVAANNAARDTSPPQGIMSNIGSALRGAGLSAVETGLEFAPTIRKLMNPADAMLPQEMQQSMADSAYSAADTVAQYRKENEVVPKTPGEKIAQIGGSFVAGPLSAVGAVGSGFDVLRRGGTMEQAAKAEGISTAELAARLYSAGFGNSILSGIAKQVPANLAIGAASRAAQGEKVLDPYGAAADVGMAFGGSLFRGSEQSPKPAPKTGDPDIDAGINAGAQAKANRATVDDAIRAKEQYQSPVDIANPPRQTDLFDSREANDAPGMRDMFSGEMKDAEGAELNRVLSEQERKPAPQQPITDPDPAQQKLNLQNSQVQQPDLLSSAATTTPYGQSKRRADTLGISREEQARIESVSKDPADVEEGDSPATLKAAKDALGRKLGIVPAAQADLAGQTSPAVDTSSAGDYSHPSITASIREHGEAGDLHTGHVLDAWASNEEGKNGPTHTNIGQALKDRAQQLGGDRTKIVDVSDDPDRIAALKREPSLVETAAGFYDPNSNKIFLIKPATAMVLQHETAHAIEWRSIEYGKRQQLEGPSQAAFNVLQRLATVLAPELKQAAADRVANNTTLLGEKNAKAVHSRETYGLKEDVSPGTPPGTVDVHELSAELNANPTFRNSLVNQKLDAMQAGKLGMDRLMFGKVRNMYEAVRAGLSRMMGLSPKMDTAYDALMSARQDFFNKLSSKEQVKSREFNSRNAAVDDSAYKAAATPAEDVSTGGDKQENKKQQYPDALKPTVTDPVSRLQKASRFVQNRLANTFTEFRTPQKEINHLKELMSSGTAWERFSATDMGKALTSAYKKEGVSADTVRKYLQRDNPPTIDPEASPAERIAQQKALEEHTAISKSLDGAPQTKALADSFRAKSAENVREIATRVHQDPNATPKEIAMVSHILDNPGYTFRGYQNEEFTAGLLRNARVAEDNLQNGKMLSATQAKAKQTVDNVKQWIKDNILPESISNDTSLANIKNRAKALGLNVRTITADARDAQGKRAALVEALNKAVPHQEAVNQAMERMLNAVAGLDGPEANIVQKYLRGAKLGDLFKQRDDIPPALAALWGQIKDPAALVITSLTKQGAAVQQLQMQANLRSLGEGRYLFDASKGVPPAGYTVPLKGPGYGTLRGMYTTPEIASILKTQVDIGKAANIGIAAANMWTGLLANSKLLRLGLDPGMYLMYLAGGPSIMLNNGVHSLPYFFRGLKSHIAEISPTYRRVANEQTMQDLQDAVKAGVNEASTTGELKASLDNIKLKEALSTGTEKGFLSSMGSLVKTAYRDSRGTLMHALSLMDGYAKRGALYARMDELSGFYERQGITKSRDEIRAEAADRIKDTTATYSRSAGFASAAERKIGLSQGLVYGTETIRNTFNAGLGALADIKQGAQFKDPKMLAIGLSKFTGVAISIGYMHSLLNGAAAVGLGAFGMVSKMIAPTDDRQKYLQQEKGPFRGMQAAEISDPNNPDKDNHFMWSPGDRNDYYYQISQPIHVITDAIAKERAGQKVDWNDELRKAADAYTSTFANNAVVKNIVNAVKQKAPSYWKDAPDLYTQIQAEAGNKFGLGPKATDSLLSIAQILAPGELKHLVTAQESGGSPTMKMLINLGLGVRKIPTDTGISDRESKFVTAGLDDAKKPLDEVLHSPADFNADQIEATYKQAFKQTYKEMKKLQDRVAFAKSYGMRQGSFENAADTGGIQDEALYQATSGKLNPAEFLDVNIDSAQDKEIERAKGDRIKIKQIEQKYDLRQKQLDALYKKYSKLTPDQIEAL